MKIQSLKRHETPTLFHDYLHNFAAVREFYRYPPEGGWDEAVRQRSAAEIPCEKMAGVLREQNQRWGAPAATLENIEKLTDRKTLAVVTGQQAGVLGGPLYTFYKAFTVIKLAAMLQKEYPRHQFVPVFWMEVNDSDFQEINSIHYITKQNRLQQLSVAELPGEENKPVSARRVNPEIAAWRAQLAEDFFDTEFKSQVLELFLREYEGEHTYADAFARLMLKLFGKYGLMMLNPSGSGICALASALFRRGLTEAPQILEATARRRKELETAGYPTQIHFSHNQTLLFFNDQHMNRVRIDFDEAGKFLLKYPEGYRPVEQEKLLQTCTASPEYLSPNVALRPLMQDSLLPTVAYVGGPSEVSYFAQIETLYRYFEIPMPVIYPRHRVTVVESKIQKIVEKYELSYAEILENRGDFIENYLRNNANQAVYRAVENTAAQISDSLQKLLEVIKEFDPTLVNAVEKTGQNIEGIFGKLSGKITRSLEQQNETQVRQLERVLLYLLPGGNYQERSLNMIYFAIKYGPGFIDAMFAQLPDDTKFHYIVEI